jgi:hypothetical protein
MVHRHWTAEAISSHLGCSVGAAGDVTMMAPT